ncbi:MAG: histone deacetylase [Planctomycetota bacterium]
MKVFYCDHFELPLPAGHRFPIDKYRLARERVRDKLGERIDLVAAPSATRNQLSRIHNVDYVEQVFAGNLSDLAQKRIGFPWSPKMLERSLRSTGATIAAAQAAIAGGISAHLSGGTHHAFADEGQGFCVFNDVAVAAGQLLFQEQANKILVVDLDVHQGNGTASIFRHHQSIFTFSMHGNRNYPFRKTEGDLDIGLADSMHDEEYLGILDEAFEERLPLSDADFCFYIAGADPYKEDRMGRLALTKGGLRRRDEYVIGRLQDLCIPTTVVMGGGYAAVEDVAEIHATTVEIAVRSFEARHSTGG